MTSQERCSGCAGSPETRDAGLPSNGGLPVGPSGQILRAPVDHSLEQRLYACIDNQKREAEHHKKAPPGDAIQHGVAEY